MPLNWLVRVRGLLPQANASVLRLPPASNYATARKDGYTSKALAKIFAQHPLAQNLTTTPYGRLHAHGPLARSSHVLTRPHRGVAHRLGFQRNPKKGIWEPKQVGDHLGLTIDMHKGEFCAPIEKPQTLARQASPLFGRATCNARWLPARQLAAFDGKAQFVYLSIAPARFFPRELHSVLASRQGWGGRVRMTRQLKRHLEWWRTLPDQHNGHSIYMPIASAYIHVDFSGYGWGAVLNDNPNFAGPRFLVRRRPTSTHHLEGATSRAPCNRVFPTAATGTQILTTHRQHIDSGYAIQANHTLPRHDDGITTAVAPIGRQRHPHPAKAHSLGSEHLGRQT
jgi:hypothetical protein